jgi:hypothetical protein
MAEINVGVTQKVELDAAVSIDSANDKTDIRRPGRSDSGRVQTKDEVPRTSEIKRP